MGTSGSVSGAGKGSPLVPDWVEQVENADGAEPDATNQEGPKPAIPITTHGRLAAARRSLGEYVKTGNRDSLQKGVAHYVRTGRGGSALATRRSAGSSRRASALSGIVGGSSDFNEIRERIKETLSASGDPQEILAAIAAAASPNDGTLDSETGQRAASEALQFVLELFPNADPLDLNIEQRELLLERFLAIDCYELFMTEVGKHLQAKVPLKVAAGRFREIKEYFCETFREANRERSKQGRNSLGTFTDRRLSEICREVIAEAYFTFEAYIDAS